MKKFETKNRTLVNRMQELKMENENLQKHNKDFKDYFDKQNERMNALRNVNQNLNKKLHQRFSAIRKEPAFIEVEQNWQLAEERAQDLEIALKMSTSQLEQQNKKLAQCAS